MAAERTLSRGMTGQDVGDLQAALNYHLRPPHPPHTPAGPARPPLVVDRDFGPATQARLKDFQKLNGLVDDGIVGQKTRPLLKVTRSITVKIPISKVEPEVVVASRARPSFELVSQTLPVSDPTPSSAPLISPVKLQNRQVQLGGSLTLDPIVGPGDLQPSSFLAVQWTWVEQKDGRHLELALGGQFAVPLLKTNPLKFGVSVQSFAQATVSDVFAIDKINLHLFSPAAQVAFQSNFANGVLKSNSISGAVQNQITWDVIVRGKNPIFSLFCQQQLGWTYDLAERKGAVAPAFLAGAIWQTSFF